MARERLVVIMLMLFIVQCLTPLAVQNASAAGEPDFDIVLLTQSQGAGVTDSTGDIKFGPGTHTITFQVKNLGTNTVPTGCDVNIYHWSSWDPASPTDTRSAPITVTVPPLADGDTSQELSVNITGLAVNGNTQRISAEIDAYGADINPNNDIDSIEFEVEIIESGSFIDSNLPTDGDRVLRQSIDYTGTALNTGTYPVNAKLVATFTTIPDDGSPVEFESNSITLQPGTLANPAQGELLTVTVNAAILDQGDYTLDAKITFTGGGAPTEDALTSATITVSNYIAELVGPANKAVEPGASSTQSFTIINTGGVQDSYVLSVTETADWADKSQHGATIGPIAKEGGLAYVDIPVTVPADAARVDCTIVTLVINSVGSAAAAESPALSVMETVTICAGDSYEGTLTPVTATPADIFPDITQQVTFSLENTGNAPTGYTVTAGLSTPATGWDIEILTSSVSTLLTTATTNVVVDVTPPALTNPLDPAMKLRAGDTVTMWIQVVPDEGGTPTIQTFQFNMRGVISVNPALDHTEVWMTEQDVWSSVTSPFEHYVDIDVSVLNNLHDATHIDETVTTALSIGTVLFDPITDGLGANETGRWGVGISPSSIDLGMGGTGDATLSILGPSDMMPLAGTITIPVIATPDITGNVDLGGVTATAVSHNFVIHIPEVSGAEISDSGPLDVGSGNETILEILLENTGNDAGSYIVSFGDDVPEDMEIKFSTPNAASTAVTSTDTESTITSLSPRMGEHPLDDGRHQVTFNISVNASRFVAADSLHEIPIRVQDSESGLYILDDVVTVRVEERVDVNLTPSEQQVNLSVYETPFTRLYVHNTGNVLTNYHVWIDNSTATQINFEIESGEDMLIAAGFNDSIKIRLTPDSNASADEIHKATVWVSTDAGHNVSAVINASIIPDHKLTAVIDDLTYIVPGETAEVNVMLVNNGNLIETVEPEVTIDGGWGVTINPISVTLDTNQSVNLTATVTAPDLDGTDSLENGDIHTITVNFVDTEANETRATATGTLVVSALFDLTTDGWDLTTQFFRMSSWTYQPTLTNTGNADLEVNLTYELTGVDGSPSTLWQIDSDAPASMTLPRNQEVSLEFSISAVSPDPSVNDIAFLKLSIDPADVDVTGSASISSTLTMSRLHDQTAKIDAGESNESVQQTIHWSHIPELASSSKQYEIELCAADRLRPELSGDNQNWSFQLTTSTDTLDLNLTTTCDADGSEENRILLPIADAWEINNLNFQIKTPVWPHIYSGDGWDLTFRLYHPDDHNSYTEYDQAVITFALNNSADPSVSNVVLTMSSNRDYLIEGTLDTATVTLKNEGTALALLVTVTLDCGDMVTVSPRQVYPIPTLNPRDEQTLTFDVTPGLLDWWDDSTEVTCTANVDALLADGDDVSNNVATTKGEIHSWAPNMLYVFAGLAGMVLITLVCLRLGLRNEKFRLAAAYSGAMSLGLLFHMGAWSWFGPTVTAFAILWMLGITWRSGDEFQLIHEDYQRARKGQNTIYREHQKELGGVRKQLTFILSMPILGYIAIVLGFPPQMNIDLMNIATLLLIAIIPMYAIRRMLKWMDFTYAELYGSLTDTEIAVDRIDRELTDPARLMRKLARYGLDGEEISENEIQLMMEGGGEIGSA